MGPLPLSPFTLEGLFFGSDTRKELKGLADSNSRSIFREGGQQAEKALSPDSNK